MPLEVLQRLLNDSDIPPARTKRFFKKADLNRDRRVNYDEFLRQVSIALYGLKPEVRKTIFHLFLLL